MANVIEALIRADCLAHLDAIEQAGNLYPNTTGDDAYSDAWLNWRIQVAAADIAAAVLRSETYPDRGDFMADSAELAYGAKLPTHIGPPGRVLVGQAGDSSSFEESFRRSLEAIRWKRDDQRLLGNYYHFITPDDYVYFAGPSAILTMRAKVNLGNYVINAADPDSGLGLFPPSLYNAIVCHVLSHTFTEGGDNVGPAQYYHAKLMDVLNDIRSGDVPRQVVPMPEAA